MIMLRLGQELENKIKNMASKMGISESELIRRSVAAFINNVEKSPSRKPEGEFFGKYASHNKNLSQDRKSLIKEKIKAKR